MKRTLSAAFCLYLMLAVSASLSAKGITTKITIKGPELTAPIQITDPRILEHFSVWAGPGVQVNGIEQTEGFIIDWSSGVVPDRPGGLRRYEVSFYVAYWNRALQRYENDSHLAYVVSYDYDPSSQQGYVYLPGRADKEYRLNTRAILHGRGLEGNWFRASNRWEETVGPLVAQRTAAGASTGEQFLGVWSGTWEGAGSGGFELTLEKAKDGTIAGKVSVTGDPTYKATLNALSFDGPKMTGKYDFPPDPAAEVLLAATFESRSATGTWSVREKANGTDVASGTWSVAKK
jgi:hypothetical protein